MNSNFIPNQGGLGAVAFPASGPVGSCNTGACNLNTMSYVGVTIHAGTLTAGALYLLDCNVHAPPGVTIGCSLHSVN